MLETYDLILENGTVVNHEGIHERNIGIRNGIIVDTNVPYNADAKTILNCKGLHILPGIIDSQVHFREPGNEHKEDLETGSHAAVLGGVTTVFEMPNTSPLTINANAIEDKLKRADNRMHCDHAFWVGATHENVDDLAELERLPGVVGVKVFMGSSTGNLLVSDDEGIGQILANINRRAAFHSEDEERLIMRENERVENDPSSHIIWRDTETALRSTQRLLQLARHHKSRIHVLHITTAEEIDLLAQNKDIASVEITPHHLSLDASQYKTLGTLMQMNPPIREINHQQRLWYAIQQGIADVMGSDHAPHTLEEKQKPYPQSPSGMTGVQTLVPMMLNHVNNGRLSLMRFIDLMCAGPQRLFGIAQKGRIVVGYDADFTLVDMQASKTITNDWIASRCGWTPYDGKQVTGWPVGTIIRGQQVMSDGELIEQHIGNPVKFTECL